MYKYNFLIIILVCFILTFAGCISKNSLTILADRPVYPEEPKSSIVASLETALENIKISLKTKINLTSSEQSILDKINSGEGDMAIVKNCIKIDDSYPNIRTVMPLFPEVFLTLYKEGGDAARIDSLISQGKVVFVINKEEEQALIYEFLSILGIEPHNPVSVTLNQDTATLHHTLKEADVIMLFSSLNSSLLRNLLKQEVGFSIYDFNSDEYTSGTVIDGFCLRFSQTVPFTIPVGTFDKLPETPIRTFGLYDVLICHKKLEPELIYDAIESIFHSKARLAQNNFEFALLNDDFDGHTFLFPVHEGTNAYLNRNQPTFWERYAELIGVIISILAITAGTISTSYHNLKQRKKDKIDEYYLKVISIGSKSYLANLSPNELKSLLEELLHLRVHVFQLLVKERISANNAFIIFLLLAQSIIQHLEMRLEQAHSFTDIVSV